MPPPAPCPRRRSRGWSTYGAGSRGRQRFFLNPTLEIVWLALNPNRPLFASERLRRAVGYAIDRPALSRYDDYAFWPDDHLLPPALPAYADVHVYPLRRPDLRAARRLVNAHGRVAVDYTCNGCSEQLTQSELEKIGLNVVIREFPAAELLQRVKTPGEPLDLYVGGTIPEYADPAALLNDVLIGRYIAALAPRDPELLRRLREAAGLSGSARDSAYRALDLWLMRRAYLVPLGHGLSADFFSSRIGCQLYQPTYGMDLGALCLR
jgi:ABC-type transport system substrate-binding protein